MYAADMIDTDLCFIVDVESASCRRCLVSAAFVGSVKILRETRVVNDKSQERRMITAREREREREITRRCSIREV